MIATTTFRLPVVMSQASGASMSASAKIGSMLSFQSVPATNSGSFGMRLQREAVVRLHVEDLGAAAYSSTAWVTERPGAQLDQLESGGGERSHRRPADRRVERAAARALAPGRKRTRTSSGT